ncbi:MAG: carboxylating nicotinate-nucleotide diphosphorylase [Proteobacteria bacterium]|nr:carboxylating nicotinate-nucleotide diphosphorylase [Pseudomonadota bacterium]
MRSTVAAALAEDVGRGDLTAQLVPASARARARVITREAGVLCGRDWVDAVFAALDPAVTVRWHADDGATVSPGAPLFEAEGPARPLLTGERTALNFLQMLSGTATAARRYVEAVRGTGCRILDTRKTLPGLRLAQKYAVRCGGGTNHRLGLYDGILIKENHIAAAGSIAAAVAAARRVGGGVPVEVEVETLEELEQAFAAQADLALLDEFSLADLATAVARNRARPRPLGLEASGGIDLDTIGAVAATGVDFISVGSITKHVRALDLSMRLELLG